MFVSYSMYVTVLVSYVCDYVVFVSYSISDCVCVICI